MIKRFPQIIGSIGWQGNSYYNVLEDAVTKGLTIDSINHGEFIGGNIERIIRNSKRYNPQLKKAGWLLTLELANMTEQGTVIGYVINNNQIRGTFKDRDQIRTYLEFEDTSYSKEKAKSAFFIPGPELSEEHIGIYYNPYNITMVEDFDMKKTLRKEFIRDIMNRITVGMVPRYKVVTQE